MPFVEESSPLGPVQQLPVPARTTSPSFFGETFPAAFRTENTVVSALVGVSTPFPERIDLDFDPFESIEGYEEFAGSKAMQAELPDRLFVPGPKSP